MSHRRQYALVGTGARATMYLDAIAGPYRDTAEIVGLCDVSPRRMAWHNRQLETRSGLAPRPGYLADHFDRMVADTGPDTIIVTTVDATHHVYITRAMELGCEANRNAFGMVLRGGNNTVVRSRANANQFEGVESTGKNGRVVELTANGNAGVGLALPFGASHAVSYSTTRNNAVIGTGIVNCPSNLLRVESSGNGTNLVLDGTDCTLLKVTAP